MKRFIYLIVLFTTMFPMCADADSFTVGKNTFLLNGEPFIIKAAEVHYPRIPRPYWEHRIQSCKALGMNTLCIYAFWNIHEQREGQFDFTGNQDIDEFCRLAQKHGMYCQTWSLRLCRMGNGRITLVAVEEEGHQIARAGSLFHGTCRFV